MREKDDEGKRGCGKETKRDRECGTETRERDVEAVTGAMAMTATLEVFGCVSNGSRHSFLLHAAAIAPKSNAQPLEAPSNHTVNSHLPHL